MRVFVTGATGFIGSAVVRELVGAGHEVVGLARSETSARTLIAAGARAHIGSFEDVDSLRKGAAGANGVIHLAFFHKISDPGFSTRLRIFLGGSPSGIVSRFLQSAVEAEKRAIEALGAVLTGDDRALVAALPTMALPQGRLATEEDAPHPQAPALGRFVRVHHTRFKTSSNTASALTSVNCRRSAVAAISRSKGSRSVQGSDPALRQVSASSGAILPPCASCNAGKPSTTPTTSGHLPSRAFCAISKKQIALTHTTSASATAFLARTVSRCGPI